MQTQISKILPLALTLSTLGLELSAIQRVNAAGFVSVSPMNSARSFHTATLLPNGKALVAGGFPTGTSAELYDPATDTWTVTDLGPRLFHGNVAAQWTGVGHGRIPARDGYTDG